MGPSLSYRELIQESQRLRQEFDRNVIQLRMTLDRTKTVTSATWIWPEGSMVRPASESNGTDSGLLDGLTPRELQVLRLIAEGKSSKEVAAELGMAFRTAVCHRYRIFQKLKVHETATVVRLAVRAGLIQP